MAQYNFEGDIDNISERQLEFINSVITEHGFENSKVTFSPVGKAGDNYAASVKRIKIEGEKGNLTMIAKMAPGLEVLRNMTNTAILFKNEHTMYSKVLPKFQQLQKEADIPEEDQLKFAKCYGSTVEQPHEVVLLEDLALSDFTMLDRFESLSDACVKSVLKNFARFHSMSYVLKHKDPATYEVLATSLTDMWTAENIVEDMKIFFLNLEIDTLAALDNPDHINLVRHKISDSLNVLEKLKKADANSKYSVIAQGDSWTNNIMFRFEEGNLAESILIDYQLSTSNSLVYDLMYMIFNCTDYETRKKHYYDWIDYYHSELEKYLSNFNLKANYVFPRDKLDVDLKRYAKLMFGLSVLLANILIRKSDDAAKIQESMKSGDHMDKMEDLSVTSLDEESRNRFKNRITGLIESFTEFGLL